MRVYQSIFSPGAKSARIREVRFLINLMRGLHMIIGIHTPPPEQERVYVYVWIGVIIFMGAGLALFFYLMA